MAGGIGLDDHLPLGLPAAAAPGHLRQELEGDGIRVRTGSLPGLAEEAPQAYKDVDAVVEVVTGAGIAAKVARLRPLAVIKG